MIRYDATQAALYREKLIGRAKADVRDCYQCGNCSAGCPAAFAFDYVPNQVMRMLQVGLVERVLDSKSIQLCVQCLTCTARCPRNIDIARIFEDLRTVTAAQDRDVPEHAKTFNEAFMGSLARFGRLPELYMMVMFYLGTRKPKMAMADIPLAFPMVTKGKMQLLPRKAKGAGEVARIYKKTMDRARAGEKAQASHAPGVVSGAEAAQGAANGAVEAEAPQGAASDAVEAPAPAKEVVG